jgi:hypothetical protein
MEVRHRIALNDEIYVQNRVVYFVMDSRTKKIREPP